MYGDFIDYDSCYVCIDEFFDVVKGVVVGVLFMFDGCFYCVEVGGLLLLLSG